MLFPLICLFSVIVVGIISYLLMRKGTLSHTEKGSEPHKTTADAPQSADTRWARGNTALQKKKEPARKGAVKKCPQCGAENPADNNFCQYCGAKL
ncbi:MAG TPA: zinc-ribbon domain-containing protein [Anaerolineae bacterium]|nr:zinc-ribbon domain-containing protein [Anaerolineae bacterium]